MPPPSELVAILRCPRCGGALDFAGARRDGAIDTGTLRCRAGGCTWPVAGGIPSLVDESQVRGFECAIRWIYDLISPFHDLGVRYFLPTVMFVSEDAGRDRYMRRLELDRLAGETRPGEPLRILDVGIGSGGNLPSLRRLLPPGLPVEIWGLDFSAGMLWQCRQRLRSWDGPPVRLLHGDAHALPFPDATFDRVLSVGGIATYRDQRRARAAMAREAKPGSPIVVVDEQLDAEAARSWYQWLAFKAITLYDLAPHAPVEHVPEGATDVRVEQASSFFYCLRYRVP